MIDWGTKKISGVSNNPLPKKFLQKSNPKKSHAELLRIKNIPKFVFVYSSYHPHLVVVLTTLETPGAQEHFEYPKKIPT